MSKKKTNTEKGPEKGTDKKTENGFTIIEVMVSLGLFGIVSAMMVTSMVQMQRLNYDNAVRTGAFSAAQQVLDSYRATDPATLPASGNGAVQNITIGGRVYNVTPRFCPTAAHCSSANIRGISLIVAHKNVTRYTVETVFSRLQ